MEAAEEENRSTSQNRKSDGAASGTNCTDVDSSSHRNGKFEERLVKKKWCEEGLDEQKCWRKSHQNDTEEVAEPRSGRKCVKE